MIGCGNSTLSSKVPFPIGNGWILLLTSAQLYGSGFKHITNVDYSPTVIAFMCGGETGESAPFPFPCMRVTGRLRAEQCKEQPEMKWLCMDATKMTFADNSIESAVDKGTLDSIMCRLDSSDLAPVFFREVYRVLKPGA
jgi:hypothetical protein